MRVKKLRTPLFFTTTTKFGVELINSSPKNCPFRYDLVWVKSAPAGFLSAKKMPMRKHEMVYVFYERLPFYDLSSHQHKFVKKYQDEDMEKSLYGKMPKTGKDKESHSKQYEPSLPTSVVKEELDEKYKNKGGLYSKVSRNGLLKAEPHYDPPLPVSVVKEDTCYGDAGTVNYKGGHNLENGMKLNQGGKKYDPPLPTSVVKEDCYEKGKTDDSLRAGHRDKKYDPPLPTSVVKEPEPEPEPEEVKMMNEGIIYNGGNPLKIRPNYSEDYDGKNTYDPPLPTTMLEIKSTRGKHSTEKPVALMEWILKYYSKEGDTILDPTMGCGSCGIACKEMNRKFIGIENDKDIFENAKKRLGLDFKEI